MTKAHLQLAMIKYLEGEECIEYIRKHGKEPANIFYVTYNPKTEKTTVKFDQVPDPEDNVPVTLN